MKFWTQNSWIAPLIAILYGLCYGPLTDGVCVKDLKLVKYHIK
jgi:hypothetical protein